MGFLVSIDMLTPGQGSPCGTRADFICLPFSQSEDEPPVQRELVRGVHTSLLPCSIRSSTHYEVTCTVLDKVPIFLRCCEEDIRPSLPPSSIIPGLVLPVFDLCQDDLLFFGSQHLALGPSQIRLFLTKVPQRTHALIKVSPSFPAGSFEECLRHTSVALGCAPSPSLASTVDDVWRSVNARLSAIGACLIPIFASIAILFGLSTFACLTRKVDRRTPLGFLVRLPTLGVPTSPALAVGLAGTTKPILDWKPWRDRKGRHSQAKRDRAPHKRPAPLFLRLLHSLGIYVSLWQPPFLVWAAPADLINAIHQLEHASIALSEDYARDGLHRPRVDPAAMFSTTSCWPDSLSEQAPYEPPGPQQVHVSILVAGHTSAHVQVPVAECDSCQDILNVVQQAWKDQPYDGVVIDTCPQVHQDYISALLVPNWTKATFKTVFIIDLSYWGGPLYAEVAWSRVSFEDLSEAARTYVDVPWDVYHAGSSKPIQPNETVNAASGDVFRFVPLGNRPSWPAPLQEAICSKHRWAHDLVISLDELPSSKCLALTDNGTWLFPTEDTPDDLLHTYIATARYTTPEQLSFGEPAVGSPILQYVKHGRVITRVIAAHPRPPDARPGIRLGSFVFLDIRQLGKEPTFIYIEDGWHDAAPILRSLGIPQPPGYEFEITGVPTRNDQVLLSHGCTIVVRLETALDSTANSVHAPDVHPTAIAQPELVMTARLPQAPWHTHRASGAELQHAIETDMHIETFDRPAPHAPLQPILVRTAPEGPPPPDFISASFLVLVPRYKAEVIQLVLRAPCEVNDAIQEVSDARDSDDALRCDYLYTPAWQPDRSFAVLLALPGWAEPLCGVLVDARLLDGRLFHCVLPDSFMRSTFFNYAGIQADPALRIFVNGRLTAHNHFIQVEQGYVVTVVPPGQRMPPLHALEDMLASSRHWTRPCPNFPGPAEAAFLLLSDGGAKLLNFATADIPSPEGFRRLAVSTFQYDLDKTSFCVAHPRVTNCQHNGQACDAVVAATEQVVRVPKPPGRVFYQSVVFIDLRPILQDFTWELVHDGLINLDRVERQYCHAMPAGYSVVIKGGTAVSCQAGTACFVAHNSILTVEFLLDHHPTSEQDSSESPGPDSDDDTDSDGESDESTCEHDPAPPDSNSTAAREPGSPRLQRSPSPRTGDARSRSPRLRDTAISGHEADMTVYSIILQVHRVCCTALCASRNCSNSFLSSALLPSLASVGKQHKLLSEPATDGATASYWLRDARTAQINYGQPWPYLRHGEAPQVPLPGDPFFLAAAGPPEPSQLTVAILVPDRQTEVVLVWLFHPVTLAQAFDSVQQARNAQAVALYPRLLPVWPQPSRHYATLLALPQ